MLTRILLMLICFGSLPGCVIMHTSVTNPNPRLKTVALVPFFNLSQEPDVDGRRFALAYYSELQKVPGFQVLPLGVSEVAMVENKLSMNNPDDVLKLAKILNVDAVVIGAVTDYSPYYPPRIGMQVSWYSPHSQEFIPGMPLLVEERHAEKSMLNKLFKMDRVAAREVRHEEHRQNKEVRHAAHIEQKETRKAEKELRKAGMKDCPEGCPVEFSEPTTTENAVIRGQSTDSLDSWPYTQNQSGIVQAAAQANQGSPSLDEPLHAPLPTDSQSKVGAGPKVGAGQQILPAPKPGISSSSIPPQSNTSVVKQFEDYCPPTQVGTYDPHQPFMSYTRLFDGSDAALVAHLRDYLEVSGDRRSGGWEAYLHRSEDFIRFTSHLMILEMLTLHGGQAKHQIIFKVRKYR
ncbi:MAG: hypothetical protein KDA70_12955 [Planctomycetaceae bacterium]|nr:hypothetical protein [Planctomycetaceae bacterium]MCA9018983.1 hypothetical protein [Planctomycetaceae bacterium]